MNTKNIFDPTYRQDYLEGYSNGSNPFFKVNCKEKSEAFNSGFNSARTEYERMNGHILEGIPQRIVTVKVLEDFLLAGMLGLSVDNEGYTFFQLNVIAKWYESGIEKYDPNQSVYLSEILEENGIQIH
ncbi:hypothetical protein [Flavobacterium sp.]|uniref:hypothetical protein n=1 Tax=Flavobacterium sp. TaxID=239 RepID=UPI0037A1495C